MQILNVLSNTWFHMSNIQLCYTKSECEMMNAFRSFHRAVLIYYRVSCGVVSESES